MADLVLGAVAGETLGRALKIVEDGLNYGNTIKTLKSTLEDLKQPVEQIKQCNQKMDLPAYEDIEKVMESVAACEKVIDKSKIHWWNCILMPCYQRELEEKDNSLVRTITVQMLMQIMKCLKDIEVKWNNHDSQTQSGGNQSNHGNDGMIHHHQIPEFTMGILDSPLMESLKFELLQNGGRQVVNFTGIAGSGKTTFAKLLCCDTRVNGKFMGNIIFESLGLQNQSSEHQVANQLLVIGDNPVLLVLDDVGPGSENLVERFRTQISSDSKILVISRVALPEFGTPYHIRELGDDDAKSLLLHFAQPCNIDVGDQEIDDIVLQVVKGCKGVPLAIKFMGSRLRGQTIEKWQKVLLEWSQDRTILDYNSELLKNLQDSLRVLEDDSINRCLMDLGLFPEDQRIPVTALIDMWVELYNLDEDGIYAMNIINQLTSMNLADILVRRKIGSDADNYYNNHFLVQHKILRQLAIHISNHEETKEERLIFEKNRNNYPERQPQQQEQQGITSYISSFVPTWLIGPKHQRVAASKVSISTDQSITPDWCNIEAPEAEVLVLNLQTKDYTLPEFIKKMRNLKVVMVTNYGSQSHPNTELKNLEVLGFLWSLKRIRLERVSLPCKFKLKNVQKLSLYMCEVKNAFENCCIPFSKAMPNLEELNIEYCKDMVKLPAGFCNIATMKKLSISSCHKFTDLPEEIGKLKNLKLLRVSYCASFKVMPGSITRLQKLEFLDISYCVSLGTLPVNIDQLSNLRKLYMSGCPIRELPDSVMKMKHLRIVICDDYTYPLWEVIKHIYPRLDIKMAKDTTLNWLLGFGSSALFL